MPDIIISLCYSAFCEPMKLKCSEFVFMHEKADGNTQPQKIEPQDTPTTLGLVNNDWIVAYKREIIICPANLCLSGEKKGYRNITPHSERKILFLEFDTLRELHEHSQEEHPGGINDAGEVLPTTPPTGDFHLCYLFVLTSLFSSEAGGIKRGATFPKGGGAGHNNSFGEISSRYEYKGVIV